MMRLIRVFPRKTNMAPLDDLAFFGDPPPLRPKADEVHISVTFTWDIAEGYRLRDAWSDYYPVVRIGGPAIDSEAGEFTPGLYLKHDVIITSRGCNRKCPWCLVPIREGKIKLLEIKKGKIIQDNNFIATPQEHQLKVFDMLRQGNAATFAGGIDARLVNNWFADMCKTITIKEVFLAADTKQSLKALETAVEKLSFLGRNKLRCYVLIAFGGETIKEAKERLEAVWDIGCLPFAQLYQPSERIEYSKEWKRFAREWSRPAIIKAKMKA